MSTLSLRQRNNDLHQKADMWIQTFLSEQANMRALLPRGTRVSWTTQRLGVAYRHYGTVLWVYAGKGHFEVRVENETTGKSRSVVINDDFRLEEPA